MDAGEMTYVDDTLRDFKTRPAVCEHPFVACVPIVDGDGDEFDKRVRQPARSMLEQAGANYFIERRDFDVDNRRFVRRIDGYKAP